MKAKKHIRLSVIAYPHASPFEHFSLSVTICPVDVPKQQNPDRPHSRRACASVLQVSSHEPLHFFVVLSGRGFAQNPP